MNGYLAIGSDFHGDYTTLDNILNQVPDGTDMRFLGDMIGPKTPNMIKEVAAISKANPNKNYYETYAGLVKDETWSDKFKKYETDAIHDTDNLIKVLTKHSLTKDMGGIISGNNEEYQNLYWSSFSGKQSPSDRMMNNNLNFTRMPKVDFYKDGVKMNDGEHVDTAIVMIPYILSLKLYNTIQKALGKETAGKDYLKQAISEVKDKIIPQIKKANPKYILQLQHELPDKSIFEPFGEARNPENVELLEILMEELSELLEEKGYRAKKYTVMYGHIEKRGKLKQTISRKGRTIHTEHIQEGEAMTYIDTKTGQTVERWDIPKGDFEVDVKEMDEENLEKMVDDTEMSEEESVEIEYSEAT